MRTLQDQDWKLPADARWWSFDEDFRQIFFKEIKELSQKMRNLADAMKVSLQPEASPPNGDSMVSRESRVAQAQPEPEPVDLNSPPGKSTELLVHRDDGATAMLASEVREADMRAVARSRSRSVDLTAKGVLSTPVAHSVDLLAPGILPTPQAANAPVDTGYRICDKGGVNEIDSCNSFLLNDMLLKDEGLTTSFPNENLVAESTGIVGIYNGSQGRRDGGVEEDNVIFYHGRLRSDLGIDGQAFSTAVDIQDIYIFDPGGIIAWCGGYFLQIDFGLYFVLSIL